MNQTQVRNLEETLVLAGRVLLLSAKGAINVVKTRYRLSRLT